MRVALVLEQFDPRRGGLEQWTIQFAARLADRGHEVHVVAGRFDARTLELPIVAHRLGSVGPRLAFAEAAQAKLLAIAPDVIHDMGAGWHCDVFHPHGGSWAAITEQKLLMQPPWLRPLKRQIDRVLRRHREFQTLVARQYADNGQILVALSQGAADDFRRFHGVSSERIRVVYNGVDPQRFSPEHRGTYREAIRRELGVNEQTVLALIVAHNFRLKGVPTLLRAMRRLKAQGKPVHLAVVGGKRLSAWRRASRRLGVDGAVSFLGLKDETFPYYAAADFYVHPTFYDTCSLVVLEAAASGLPIITTRLNGVSELLSDGVDGLLLSDASAAGELADRMSALVDESLRRKMGRAARQMALKHTLDRNVDEILAVYDQAVDSRRRHLSGSAVFSLRPRLVENSSDDGPTVELPRRVDGPSREVRCGMRIGLALDKFDPRRGGAEQWTMQFAARLLQQGHEVHVVARQFGEQVAALPLVAHPLPGVRSRVGFAKAAEAKLRSLSLDVVHDLGWGWHCDVFQPRGGSWTANAEQKLLCLPRWARPGKRQINRLLPRHREFQSLFARQYADRGQIMVALSQMVADDFRRLHGVSPERIRVVYNGVDTTRFSPESCAQHRHTVRRLLGIDEDTVVLLITAHNFSLKGVPALLRAVAALAARREPVHLVVVGGRPAARHAWMARRLGAARAVTFVGPVDDPVPFYAASDVYVHPTFYDSFGLAILEAASCGLPVITSRFAGAAELLSEGVDGHVLADPADVDELLARLQPLLSDASLRARMGEAARQMAQKHPFGRNVDELMQVYHEAVTSSRRVA